MADSKPVWGAMPTQPTIKPSDVTAGTKGKIIMSSNVVTRKGAAPANPLFQSER